MCPYGSGEGVIDASSDPVVWVGGSTQWRAALLWLQIASISPTVIQLKLFWRLVIHFERSKTGPVFTSQEDYNRLDQNGELLKRLGSGWYPVFAIDAKAVADSRVRDDTTKSVNGRQKRKCGFQGTDIPGGITGPVRVNSVSQR